MVGGIWSSPACYSGRPHQSRSSPFPRWRASPQRGTPCHADSPPYWRIIPVPSTVKWFPSPASAMGLVIVDVLMGGYERMGVVAAIAAVFGLWRFVSHRAAYILLGFLALGLFAYVNSDERTCRDRAWFCPLVSDKPEIVKVPEPCPPDEPIAADSKIFQTEAANAEVRRQIQSGVCQRTAIERVARGWRAPYDPSYQPQTQRAN